MCPVITRRDFARTVGLAAAATSLAACTSTPQPAAPPVAHTAFASLKQVDAGVLNVGYAEDGPPDGPPVVLLHGWPYDIHSYVDVAPILAARGYRVLVPYLRGYGSTRFRSADTVRNGQQTVLATDVIAFMDALRIPRAVIGGFDWGARTADIVAALWPERVKALVPVSGYLIVNRRHGFVAACSATMPPDRLRHRTADQPASEIRCASSVWSGHARIDSAR
jgi:pimeloyl-ACP methyl ester carboxylesterase